MYISRILFFKKTVAHFLPCEFILEGLTFFYYPIKAKYLLSSKSFNYQNETVDSSTIHLLMQKILAGWLSIGIE